MKISSFARRVTTGGMQSWAVHRRAVERQRNGEPIILLSIGQDPAAGPPERVIERAVQSLHAGRHHYTGCQGEPGLREAIATDHYRKTGQQAGADCCVVFAGAQNALFAILACLLEPGDEVIVPEPYYSTYPATLTAMGATLMTVATTPEQNFQLDPNRIEAALTSATRAVVINSPNNPTGAVYGRGAVQAVADICRRHDLWLVSDEVYADFCFDKPHLSPASLPGMEDRCITISSLSKSHRMPGWRVGWAVVPALLVPYLVDLNLCMLYGLPGFIQDAASQALADNGRGADAIRDTYRARRDRVCEQLEGLPGLGVHRPQGGMFVMLDVRPLGLDSTQFAMGLLDRHGVAVLPADGFGTSASGHLRLGLVASVELLDEACARISEYLKFLTAVPGTSQ